MTDLPPHLAASVDQWRAAVRDLTDEVRDHKQVCDVPACVGRDLFDWLCTHIDDLPALMALCLIDRAALPPDGLDAIGGHDG